MVKVIESELQAYVSATKGRVVHIIIFFFLGFVPSLSLSQNLLLFLVLYNIYDLNYHSQPLPQHGLCGHAEADKH